MIGCAAIARCGVALTVFLAPVTAALAETEESTAHDENRQMLLRAPFSVPRASFFHAALEVPPLESARPLAQGTLLVRLRDAQARSNWEWPNRVGLRTTSFDGIYHEWGALDLAWGAVERIELGARGVYAGWDEHRDRFNLFDRSGQPLVFGEDQKILGKGATSRHENPSVLGVKVKGLLVDAGDHGFDLALAASAKFPVGPVRDLTAGGTTDLAFTLLGRLPVSWGALHASLGGTVPFGEQRLFVRSAGIDLEPFLHGAVGATWVVTESIALGLQLEANTSAFREVDVLERAPVTTVFGFRKALLDHLILEGGAGTGLFWRQSYQWLLFTSMAYEF